MVGAAALVLAGTGLIATAWAQWRPLGRHRRLLDDLAAVPEWRFYAAASIRDAADLARDPHLLVRDRDDAGVVGAWAPVLWHRERSLRQAIWNPGKRTEPAVLSMADDLANAYATSGGHTDATQQSIPYLVLLRQAFAAAPRSAGAQCRQFLVVRSLGRAPRALGVDFVSGWHRW